MTTHVTQEESRKYYTDHLTPHIEAIIKQLSLYPDDSLVHNVERYGDGLRVTVEVSLNIKWHIYCLPWMRGWSVFTSPLNNNVEAFSWRTVPVRYAPYQMPVYNPRNELGPWRSSPEQVAAALEYTVRRVARTRTRIAKTGE